jgi:hypothetical protein
MRPTVIASGPAVGSMGSWVRIVAGFAVLCAVLLGTSALDATGRWGLVILAAAVRHSHCCSSPSASPSRGSPLAVPRRLLETR